MGSRLLTVNDVLAGHVTLDVECLDRIYLNGYVPNLQVGGQVVQFLAKRGFPIPSPALIGKIGDRFRESVRTFASSNHIPVVKFGKHDRKITVMTTHLRRQAATGRSGVAAIGVAQEFQRVATCSTTPARSGGAPHFGWGRADRRVTCFYFYVWDADFGPFFLKFGAYFPYTAKLCLLTELRAARSIAVVTVPSRDRTRRATGPGGLGGCPAGWAAGNDGSVRAVPAA